jgi:probable F420-dependent oxidoreductase
MKFGIETPTGLTGMFYPVPFATAEDVVHVALESEQLGYYDVGGNDHLSTQQFVRDAWPAPPDYFEPLITLANIAAQTSVLRLTTGIIVLPMRQPILLAKQVATLDNLSGGRVILGVAVGGYRDEFETVVPELKDRPRAEMMYEAIEALRVLFEQRNSTYQGKHYRFENVESFPKPLQTPLPIYSGGNADGSLRRAAELCQGWLPAALGPAQITEKRVVLDGYARAAGRDPVEITTALQSVVHLARTPGEARGKLENSAFPGLDQFRKSIENTMNRGGDTPQFINNNLIGTPDQVCEKVAAYQRAGVEAFRSLLFVGNTVEEMTDQILAFARYVIPAFPTAN